MVVLHGKLAELNERASSLGISELDLQYLVGTYSSEELTKAFATTMPLLSLSFQGEVPNELSDCFSALSGKDSFYQKRLQEWDTVSRITNLYKGLMNRFNRVPNIFPYLVEMIDEFNVDELVKTFDVKGMRYALSLDKDIPSIHHRITYGIAFHSRVYDVLFHLAKMNRNLESFVAGFPCRYPLEDKKLELWVIAHAGKTKNETIHEVMAYWQEPGFPQGGVLEVQKSFFAKRRMELEWDRCQRKYPHVFEKEFTCRLEDSPIHAQNESACLLHPNDKKQVLLGQLSVCCQRLGGSAEASMMEGLINPDSGFLVFERGTKLLAQSWVWLSENQQVLVLDNIEFADNRQPEHILPLLREWVTASPYPDIQMGIGFNKMQLGEEVAKEDMGWFTQHWNHRYTDANERVWLKRNQQVLI